MKVHIIKYRNKIDMQNRIVTAQTPRVRMKDYRSYLGIYAPSVHHKINVRANILKCGRPVNEKML